MLNAKSRAFGKNTRMNGTRNMTQQEWEQLNQQLLKKIGQNNFKTWIEPLKFRDLQNGIATFHVPTNFLGNYVSQNFSDAILHELRTVDPSVCRLSFAVPTRTSTSRSSAPTATAPAVKVAAPRPTLNTAPLDKRFTFDSFVVGKPNELAHAAAKRVAEAM
jgi:chromosomal replication initiator protein